MSHKKIRVLVVDDSSVIRMMITRILAQDPEIEVVGSAPDPYVAREKIVALQPDVMTLDIEMPRMDGITFLEKVMTHMPVRTIIISSLSTRGSETALRALEVGAVEVLAKPAIDVSNGLAQMAKDLIETVKAVSKSRLPVKSDKPATIAKLASGFKKTSTSLSKTTHQLLAIASSTGGTEALKRVMPYLPEDLPGTLIVQHMPPVFTKTYAQHLQELCPFEVKEAEDGDKISPGRVLIAPGNFHMEVVRNGAFYHVRLHQEPPLHGVRPAADYMMKSVAKYVGGNAIGLVLTGMGKDGAEGALAMKKAGAYIVAQDEATSVVYGMPKAAAEIGAVDRILPLQNIANELSRNFDLRKIA